METKVNAKKNEIWLVNLDPRIGSEIKKSQPCVIVDKIRLTKKLGPLDKQGIEDIRAVLTTMFSA
jgi:mRNA-degrading endonuclease toxin of MazEF toxin-antitoxin module